MNTTKVMSVSKQGEVAGQEAFRRTVTKVLCSLFALLLILCTNVFTAVTPALASGMNEISTTYVRDHYQLLSSSDLQKMESQAAQLSSTYGCNVYLTIVDGNNIYSTQEVREYAKQYWNTYDLGSGTERDGIMFLIAVDSRYYVTITHGQGQTGGVTIFTDYRIGQIEDAVTSELSDNDWVDGCQAYLDKVSDTLAFYQEQGQPWDTDNDPDLSSGEFTLKVAATILIPLLIAGGLCFMWARQMKTARLKNEASDYLDRSSFVLTKERDTYLTTTRSVIKIEREESGGGSSIDSGGFGGSSGGRF